MTKSKKIAIIIFLFIICIYKFSGLKWGLPYKTLSLRTYHPDESSMLFVMQNFQPSRLNFDPGRIGNGDLFIYMTGAAIKFAQMLNLVTVTNDRNFYENNLIETSKLYLIGRILANIFFIFTVTVLFFTVEKIFSFNTALFCVFIFLIIPVYVLESHFYYTHIPILLPYLISIYFSYNLLITKNKKYYIFSAIFAGLAGALQYDGIFAFVYLFAAHLIISEKKFFSNIFDKKIISSFFIAIFAFIAGTPYFLKYFPRILVIMKTMFFNHSKLPTIANIHYIQRFYYLFRGPIIGLGLGLYILFTGSIIYIILKICRDKKNQSPEKNKFYFLFIGFWFHYFVFIISKYHFFHYLTPMYMLMSVFIGYFIGDIFKILKLKIFKFAFAVILLIIFYSTINYSYNIWRHFNEEDIREKASNYIIDNIPEGAIIGVINFYYYTPPIIQYKNQNKFQIARLDYSEKSVSEREIHKEITKVIAEYQINPKEILKKRIEKFEEIKPDYFVISSSEYLKDFPQNTEFYNYLLNNKEYKLICKLSKNLDIGINGYIFKNWKIEGRYKIINPNIEIFERIKKNNL